MDWNTILHYVAEFGAAAVPILGTIIMGLVSALFYQATGLLPGFVRAYVDRAYREKEAMMRASIERALLNGLNAAVARGRVGDDALAEALDHAMRTQPEGIRHFMDTSNMTRATLETQAKGLAVDHGVDMGATPSVPHFDLSQLKPTTGNPPPRFYVGDPPGTTSSGGTTNRCGL